MSLNSNLVSISSKSNDEKYCKHCANVINIKAEICPKCGVRQDARVVQPKNKLAAALLGLFLGCFGIQFFYLGRPLAGVLSLLFFWTGIPSIIGFIHGIILLVSSEADFYNKYNKIV